MASKSIPWRELPYLRKEALDDVCKIADLYGSDLLDQSPRAEWLDLSEGRCLLDSMQASRWRHSLDKQGQLKPFALDSAMHFVDFFWVWAYLSLAAARNGLRVGPSIDKVNGIGHTDEFLIDLTKASDRRIVWALIVVLSPLWIHMGFPCTFWVQISHWTRIRDLDKNEATSLEALVFIQFSRQVVYYQASCCRHSSIEIPRDSVSWNLDIVKDMICAGGMACVFMDLCPW